MSSSIYDHVRRITLSKYKSIDPNKTTNTSVEIGDVDHTRHMIDSLSPKSKEHIIDIICEYASSHGIKSYQTLPYGIIWRSQRSTQRLNPDEGQSSHGKTSANTTDVIDIDLRLLPYELYLMLLMYATNIKEAESESSKTGAARSLGSTSSII